MDTGLKILLIMCASCFECRAEDKVTQSTQDVIAIEGQSVTLGCTYSTMSAQKYLFWYIQYPNGFLKYILRRDTLTAGETVPGFERFDAHLNKTSSSVPLTIQKAQLFDSAVYYCALMNDGGFRIYFGQGTKVIVEAGEPSPPSYYKLKSKDDAVSACLATDFSAYNATDAVDPFNRIKINPTRIAEDPFDKVVILTKDIEKCPEKNETETDVCDSGAGGIIETDEKINFLSLTILGLRILFLKSIVFNVLMTLRAWMS